MSRPPSARTRATAPNETSKPSSTSSPVTCSLIHPFEIARSRTYATVDNRGCLAKRRFIARIDGKRDKHVRRLAYNPQILPALAVFETAAAKGLPRILRVPSRASEAARDVE